MRALVGFVLLFVLYQAPQGIQDYVYADRRLWLAITLAFFPAAHWISRWLGGEGLRAYGLAGRPFPALPVGVILGLAASAGAGFVAHALGFYRIDSVAPVETIVVPALLLALGSAAASLAEDILIRGFPWAFSPARGWSTPAFAAASAALFVANHIYVISRGAALWVFLFALGFGLAWALHRTGTLWLTFGAHWGWNLAYHWSNLLLNTTDLGPRGANTWVSAACATALSAALAMSQIRRVSGHSGSYGKPTSPN